MKSKLLGLMALVPLLGLSPSAQAATLNFDFSITNTVGDLSGTVTGVIELPSACTTCSAVAVIINSIPLGFSSSVEGLTFPLDTTTAAGSVPANTFTVVAGALTTEDYEAYVNGAGGWDFYLISSNPPYQLTDGVEHSVGSDTATFTPVGTTTPLPAALPLFASGLGALGLFGWRRKRKNAAAVATA
jgi:hypothetical protein